MKFDHKPYIFPKITSQTAPDGKRHYTTPDGNQYPSVTTVLGELSKKKIQEWRERVGEEEANRISGDAARHGTKVHKLCEKYLYSYLNNDLVVFNANYENQVAAAEAFWKLKTVLDENVSTIHTIETSMYSDQIKTAGTADLFCVYNGIPTIVDFKTSLKFKKEEWIEHYFLQSTAYALMVYEHHKIVVPQIAVLIATNGIDKAQVFVKRTKDYLHKTLETFENYHMALAA